MLNKNGAELSRKPTVRKNLLEIKTLKMVI